MNTDTMLNIGKIVHSTPERQWTVPKLIGINGKMEHGKDTIGAMLRARFGHTPIAFASHLRHICNRLVGIPMTYMLDKELKSMPIVKIGNGFALPFDARSPQTIGNHIAVVLGQAYMVSSSVFMHADQAVASSGGPTVGRGKLNPTALRKTIINLFNKHIMIPMHNGKVFTGREIMQLVGTEIFRAADPDIWTWAFEQQCNQNELVAATDMRFPNEFDLIKARGGVTLRVVRPGYTSPSMIGTSHASETALDNHAFDFTIFNTKTIVDLWLLVAEVLSDYAQVSKEAVDKGYAKVITA